MAKVYRGFAPPKPDANKKESGPSEVKTEKKPPAKKPKRQGE